MVQHVALVRNIHRQLGERIRIAHAGDAQPLREEELERNLPVVLERFGLRGHAHPVLHRSGARGQQPVDAGDFHDAQPAGAHGRDMFQPAERRNVFSAGARHFQNGLANLCGDVLAIDANGDFVRHSIFP